MKTRETCIFLLSLSNLRLPPKKTKSVVSAKNSRQQDGLKAISIFIDIMTILFILSMFRVMVVFLIVFEEFGVETGG